MAHRYSINILRLECTSPHEWNNWSADEPSRRLKDNHGGIRKGPSVSWEVTHNIYIVLNDFISRDADSKMQTNPTKQTGSHTDRRRRRQCSSIWIRGRIRFCFSGMCCICSIMTQITSAHCLTLFSEVDITTRGVYVMCVLFSQLLLTSRNISGFLLWNPEILKDLMQIDPTAHSTCHKLLVQWFSRRKCFSQKNKSHSSYERRTVVNLLEDCLQGPEQGWGMF